MVVAKPIGTGWRARPHCWVVPMVVVVVMVMVSVVGVLHLTMMVLQVVLVILLTVLLTGARFGKILCGHHHHRSGTPRGDWPTRRF